MRAKVPRPGGGLEGSRRWASLGAALHRTTILPDMTRAEALETTRIHSVAGLTGRHTALVPTRPCRAPPHPLANVGVLYYAGVIA